MTNPSGTTSRRITSGTNYDAKADQYIARVYTNPHNALYERPATLSLLPPLTTMSAALQDCGCVIERLLETQPAASMESRYPETFVKLKNNPWFLMIRARKIQDCSSQSDKPE